VASEFFSGCSQDRLTHRSHACAHTRPQISQTFLKHLDKEAARCNYTDYISTYMTYPSKGLLPFPRGSVDITYGCEVWGDIVSTALLVDPAFNMYRIKGTVSLSLFQKGGKQIDGGRRVVSNLVGCPGSPYVQRTDYTTTANRLLETPSFNHSHPSTSTGIFFPVNSSPLTSESPPAGRRRKLRSGSNFSAASPLSLLRQRGLGLLRRGKSMKYNIDIDIRQLAQGRRPCLNRALDFRHGRNGGEGWQ
jgi:hypothetical protein